VSVLSKIPIMDDNELRQLFINAHQMIENSKMLDQSNAVINAIEEEWQRRLVLFEIGEYKADTPEEVVLRSVGYRVGKNGLSLSMRHRLLDYIMTRALPQVGSPAYMAEWGHPMTQERYRKLHRVIRVLASSGKNFENMDIAVHHWEADLNYIENKYRGQFY